MIMTEERRAVATACSSYGPGHMLHWTHWKAAASAPSVTVERVMQVGETVELVVEGQEPLLWCHHDPSRLAEALRQTRQPVIACPDLMALRVDGFWFNCAPVGTPFTLCS